ncbi:amino acid adenylation domain-containing protein [Paraglaciecola sp.]|uniref:amino acid adenylation domain-containing protein n=1 Tax=Paraglaciecola sp. TaxID=1920173 RepID=UPI0030F39071
MNIESKCDLLAHEIFERYARVTPNKTAVVYNDIKISYGQLNRRANFLAMHLVEQGVESGDIVGLSMSRSVELIIAILAVLKAGAAFLPLDEANPSSRVIHCLEEANVSVLIVDHVCHHSLFKNRIKISTKNTSLFTGDEPFNLYVPGTENDKIYVMFTSGSTGKPKGVVIPHRAVIRLVRKSDFVDIKPQDTFLQFAPLTFDASTFEIWGPLLNGATLVLYPGQGLDPNLFAQQIEQHQISILWLTAALFHLIANRYLEALKPVKTLLAGGDVLQPNLVRKVIEGIPGIRVINGYGPTENTTFTCCHPMDHNNIPTETVPIGKAIGCTRLHILNEALEPVIQGNEGMLYVSGKGVALGYLNMSSDAFFHNKNIAKGLIYKTGDVVVENEHGELRFVGRQDNQVKVRGYRVSLEEIQIEISKIAQVSEAVVLVQKFDGGDQLLIAHVQVKDDASIDSAQIKQILRETLPAYMVPDKIYFNVNLPLNKNGKIDKKSVAETFI